MRAILVIALALVAVVAAGKIPKAKREMTAGQKKLMQAFVGLPNATPKADKPSEHIIVEDYFTTRVDHFNLQSTDEWAMRYLIVPDYYEPGGPILISISGFGPLFPFAIGEGSLIYDMAKDLKGIVIGFEPRFYGLNRVGFEDTRTENLRLLNTDQVLADLAELVQYLKREIVRNENAGVLVAGSNYGGALASWFRIRYPHLAQGAWSSSGFQRAVMEFEEFNEAWGESLISLGSQQCYNDIFVAFHVLENLVDAGRTDILNDRFNLCDPIDGEDELQVEFFFGELMTALEFFTLLENNVTAFDRVCDELTGSDATTSVDALANWFNEYFAGEECALSRLEDLADLFREDDWDDFLVMAGLRQTLYLECTEFGWFRTASSDNQPFGSRIDLNIYAEMCRQVFGDWFTVDSMLSAVVRTNNRYGGDSPVAQNVHYSNGAEDPWRTVSITRPVGPDTSAQVIPRELLSADLWSISDLDSEELAAAKTKIKAEVASFLYPATPYEVAEGVQQA
ncbi:putative serine protease F56F10.1 [Uranotaenia lowii]|uniref:putative serine protease F56F10.1 n=1 Tax=Uranotaenia lowii TaxID=190385 RepID=UPI00247865F7|nr:putative serine protease F56F10.1 [Uranotaenia lowii]